MAAVTRDGNKWLEAESQQGPFVATILSTMEVHLQLLCPCLKLLSLLIIIQTLSIFFNPCWNPSCFARWLEESGEICQSPSPCSHEQLDMSGCDGLTLAGHQLPTKAVLSLPHPQLDRGGENITKGSWVKIRTV